uniref:Activin_recp domain-containing protein n=2 Tax=Bursaphelenchus xylophilus TaxID=6326 RepID=A0A1I7RZV8_BURXY
MKVPSIIIFIFVISFTYTTALKCKCTQSSNRNPCDSGICEVDANGSCLTLNHEASGFHYACSTSKLSNGQCTDKTTKSGQKVTVCSCSNDDYCNFQRWGQQEQKSIIDSAEDDDANSSSSLIISTSLMLISAVILRWIN